MFKPTQDNLLVKLIEKENKVGAILLTSKPESNFSDGIVKASGPGRTNEKGGFDYMEVKVGDTVCFPSHRGQKIVVENEEFLLLNARDICGVYYD